MEYYAVPGPIEVAFAPPAPQRRLTVAFRVILVIPHAVALALLTIALAVVVFVGWFAAVAMGRLPRGIAGFVAGSLRYATRVYGYAILLTDKYPPLSMSPEPDYPLEAVIFPGRLSRLTVFFRIVLAIPAWIVVSLLGAGFAVAAFLVWLILLATGRMPASLYQALAAYLRYLARFHGYMGLVTDAYPRGLFGDPAAPPWALYGAAPPPPVAPYGAAPPPPAAPYRAGLQFPAEPYGAGPPAPAEPHWAGPPVPPMPVYGYTAPPNGYLGASPSPRATRLVLSQGAKWILVLFLAIGLVSRVAESVALGTSSDHAGDAAQLQADHSTLEDAIRGWESHTLTCAATRDLACARSAAALLAPAYTRFAGRLSSDLPSGLGTDATRLHSQTVLLAGLLQQMSTAPDAGIYARESASFAAASRIFDADFRAVSDDTFFNF